MTPIHKSQQCSQCGYQNGYVDDIQVVFCACFYKDETKMTPEQENHLETIKQLFDIWADRKYRAGQKEHGGNLYDLSHEQLLDNAIDECIDQFIYLVTIREKVKMERHISRLNEPTYRETTD